MEDIEQKYDLCHIDNAQVVSEIRNELRVLPCYM